MSSDDFIDLDVDIDSVVADFMDEFDLDQELVEPLTNLMNAVTRVQTLPADSDATCVGVPRSIVTQRLLGRTLPEEALERKDLIAVGGMAEIYEARDHRLHRKLAMKVLLQKYADIDLMRGQFLDEAQITAQLSHPGIPPVHEISNAPGERPYFTMKRVMGVTLSRLLRRFHQLASSGPGTMSETPSASHVSLSRPASKVVGPDSETDFPGEAKPAETSSSEGDALELMNVESWTAARMLSVFQRVCEAVGYAHARGVIHRDLKPANLMVGAFGEVLVMDWGLATVGDPVAEALVPEEPISTVSAPGLKRVVGGTPGYMAPEQARRNEQLTAAADVFALGVILHELITGRRPYRGTTEEVLQKAMSEDLARPSMPSYLDDGLWSIITKSLSPHPRDRFQDAGELATEIERWSAGALRREEAVRLVMQGLSLGQEVKPKRRKAASHRRKAAKLKSSAADPNAVKTKSRIWRLEDLAGQLEREAALLKVEVRQLMRSALIQAPDLSLAHQELAKIYHANHIEAEAAHDRIAAARYEVMLRANDTGEFQDYLSGVACLSAVADVPCEVTAHRFTEKDRRLVPGPQRILGELPIDCAELEIGSYLLEFKDAQNRVLRYPVVVDRTHGWNGLDPDCKRLVLPVGKLVELQPHETLVAAGWFQQGGDPLAQMPRPAKRLWCEGVVMQRYPVTMREIAEFLGTEQGKPWRTMVLRDGLNIWKPSWPAVGVSIECARAYAEWLAERTQSAWRLPTDEEWEKAARGPDGRRFPWGDFGDVLFCHVRDGGYLPSGPVAVDANLTDCSPYGVCGFGGNVREWVETDDRKTWVRGGSWSQPMTSARSASRTPLPDQRGYPDVGFRLVRSI